MPQGFRIADTEADLFMGPMGFERAALSLAPFAYYGVARLKPGMTVADANADIARMMPIWLESWPPGGGTTHALTRTLGIATSVRPLKQDVVGGVGHVLWLAMAAIGVVLLIACANVANLMLIRARRAPTRARDSRRARRRSGALARALLLEGLAVGLVEWHRRRCRRSSGALRLLVTHRAGELCRGSARSRSTRKHRRCTRWSSSLAGFVVGLALRRRFGRATATKGCTPAAERRAGPGQQRIQQSLVSRRRSRSPSWSSSARGWRFARPRRCAPWTRASPAPSRCRRCGSRCAPNQVPEPERVARRQQEIVDAIAALPGVSAVGFASSMPMDAFNISGGTIEVEGRPREAAAREPTCVASRTSLRRTSTAVGMSLLAGRDLSWADLYDGRPVVLVSENMARELWGAPTAALGKRLRMRERCALARGRRRRRGRARRRPARAGAGDRVLAVLRRRRPLPLTVSRSVVIAVRSRLAGTEAFNAECRGRLVGGPEPAADLGAHARGHLRSVAGAHDVHAGDARHRRRRGARCSASSGSTACCRTPSRCVAARLRSAWRSAPSSATCVGSSSGTA